jgi:hypothetical protein
MRSLIRSIWQPQQVVNHDEPNYWDNEPIFVKILVKVYIAALLAFHVGLTIHRLME